MKITPKKESERYPLRAKDLTPGQFAEAENGTVVIMTDTDLTFNSYQKVINVENGIGGYSSTSKFRLIPNHSIEFETGADSKAQYGEL